MSVELFRGITLHHKDGYDVHPIIKDGGVKIGGEVISGDEAIVKALLAGERPVAPMIKDKATATIASVSQQRRPIP